MRRVKFRGKMLEGKGMLNAGDWIEGGYYCDDCYGGCPEGKRYIITWNSGYGGFTDLTEVDRNTVGEWTGIEDVNGRSMFEGDVVIDFLTGDHYEVIWDTSGGQFLFSNTNKDKAAQQGAIDYYELEDITSGFGFSVVGNVHDQPTLLGASAAVSTE